MKWIKRIFIALIAVVALAFVALLVASKGAKGVGKNEATILIERPATQVYGWLTEPEKLTKWIGGLEESTPLTEGGLEVGARWREVMIIGNQRYEMVSEVTDFVPDKMLAVKISSQGYDVEGRYELEEENGNTHLRYVGVAHYKPFFARLMEPLVTPAAQKKLEEDLRRLKSRVESEPMAPSELEEALTEKQ